MPTELALLPFIESAFNPQAVSSAKAAGMWQFMPATGKDFDLKQNMFRDDRRDVLASTRAALDYLQKLYGMFGDWHLALAAYNWGEGSVGRAIAKKPGMPARAPAYTDLSMPMETRLYVPKLQAVKNIVANPVAFRVELPLIEQPPLFPDRRDHATTSTWRWRPNWPRCRWRTFRHSTRRPADPSFWRLAPPRSCCPGTTPNVFQSNLRGLQRMAVWPAGRPGSRPPP